jgi:hypothetical protein
MERNHVLKVRPSLLTLFIAICCAFWLWMELVSNFPIDTRGTVGNAIGNITLILQYLYVVVEPLLGIAIIAIASMAFVRRSAPLSNVITLIFVAAALGLWAWSLSPSGQLLDLRWRK